MKKILILTAFFVCEFQLIIFSQVSAAWINRYSGTFLTDDFPTAMTIDNSGNVYVTGSVLDSTATSAVEKLITIKYNTDGELIWVAKYGDAPVNKRGTAIAVDAEGNVYTTGWISGSSSPVSYITIKYDVTGQKQWDVIYNSGWNGYATAITLDNQGNVYVTGHSSGGTTDYDYATIKYDPCGQQQWVARYSEPLHALDIPKSIVVDDSGYVYVTGTSYDSTTFFDIVTIKYDQLGQQQWVRRYDDPGLAGSRDDCAFAIAIDNDRNIIITGGTQGLGNLGLPPEFYQDCVTIKYNPHGDTAWIRKYDSGRGQDWGTDLVIDSLNNIYIAGSAYGQSSSDYLTLKYSSDGQLLWDKYYNGPLYASGDYASAIAIDNESNLYITGKSKALNWEDFATLKYNSLGELQWVIRYDGPSNGIDQALSIAVDPEKNVYVFGKSLGGNYRYDFLTIKYIQESIVSTSLISNSTAGSTTLEVVSIVGFSIGDSIIINPGGPNEEMNKILGFGSIHLQSPLQYDHFAGESVIKLNPTDVKDDQNIIPSKFELHQNYPNPFNPTTKIKYRIPNVGTGLALSVLKVYDLLGNEVATLVNEYKPAGSYEVEFNGNNLASGIYFCRMQAGNYISIKKMMLLK
ncbi:PKD repeat protein [Ignavibacterium album JCM 16511]|uniref:PKD repeat protein n=1 Tax=Ignavibacterium album (strain DSM 19864 / JCM 16511 / NBRC 101810 / Mat9-16) TaxID=945713 RepID=I0AFZ0_IGNAJ|nr:SBBP repeat-containing protein [Ignavibacterium album]AFH47897.1 PKD repeat protein [Ignavibacterium album JCM 16511]